MLRAFSRQTDTLNLEREPYIVCRGIFFLCVYVIQYLVRLHAERTEFKFFIHSMEFLNEGVRGPEGS